MKKSKKKKKYLELSNKNIRTTNSTNKKAFKSKGIEDAENIDTELNILLTDYSDIRNEIHSRVADTNRYLELSLLILGGFIATITLIKKSNQFMLLGFPFSLCCMVLLIIRSDYMVLNLAKYSVHILKKDIGSLIGNKIRIFQWEEYRYRNDLNNGALQQVFTLFLGGVRIAIPFILSVMLVIFYVLTSMDDNGEISNIIDIYIIIIMIIGVSLTFIIIITWAIFSKNEYEKLARGEHNE